MRKALAVLLSLVTLAAPVAFYGQGIMPSAPLSHALGVFYAAAFNNWRASIVTGNTVTGATTIVVSAPSALGDSNILPIAQVFSAGLLGPININDANAETVTPTAISIGTCPNTGVGQCATITGTFNNLHGASNNGVISSGSYGLVEAIGAAQQSVGIQSLQNPPAVFGGTVVVDGTWAQLGGTTAMITAATPYPNVMIRDERGTEPQFYSVQPNGTTRLAVPSVLVNTTPTVCTGTATVCSGSAASLGGTAATWTSTSNFFCVTYVDIMGHEGRCSPTMSFTTAASVVVQGTAPAASAGAVGYLVYAGTSYAAATRLPIVQGTTGGPTCTLTTIETVTPACAVANSTYNQSGSPWVFALKEASTQPQPPGATITTFTTLQAFDEDLTTYAYAPANIETPNITNGFVAFAASTGTSGTTWELGRALIRPGFLNTIGKTIRITGQITDTGNTVPTTGLVIAMGPPWTASAGASVCSMVNTTAQSAVVWNISFSCTITTQTQSVAAGTGGTVLGNGWMQQQFTTQTTAGNLAVNNIVAAVTVNLYGATELEVLLTPTSSTGMTSPQLTQLSVEALN